MVKFCPYCGNQRDEHSRACLICGKKILELPEPVKEELSSITSPSAIETKYQSQSQDEDIPTSLYQPILYHPSMKAPWTDRCLACTFRLWSPNN